MTQSLRLRPPSDVLQHLRPGTSVFIPGMGGESLAFFDLLKSNPERADRVTFIGAHFPGINRSDYLGLHPGARQRAYFMAPMLRERVSQGRADLIPVDYPGIVRDLEQTVNIDVAIAQVSPPDAEGRCGLGACYDFVPSVWKKARIRIAHVNPSLPRTTGSFLIDAADCTVAFEADAPIPTLAADEPDAATLSHAAHVANLVRDGDSLEFGVGRLQAAVLASLKNHRRLKVYSGMVSTPITGLLDAGVIEGERAIEVGSALGEPAFYERMSSDPTFYFRPTRETHDVRRLAALPSFCAINSAIEVDLMGQVNADSMNGRLVAGVGGLPAFAIGARLSPGGRSIIILPSAGDSGRASRIVTSISGPTALPRHEADYVVTEHGVAELRGRSLHERARALIAIAAPQFRDSLAASWHELAQRF